MKANRWRSVNFYTTLLLLMVLVHSTKAQVNERAPTYVLVHGAWHGGWCWQKVSAKLRAEGDIIYTPTLSGLGEHKNTLDSTINLETHITDIVNLIITEDLHNVILVGHSYAGTVIAGVADRIPERLSKLVFLDAMLVDNGESALSVQSKENREGTIKAAKNDNGLSVPFWPATAFGVTNPDDVKWVNDRLTPQPYRSFTQRQVLKHPFGNHLPLIYIACTNPMIAAVKKFSVQTSNNKRWKHYTLDTGHDAMIIAPGETAKLLSSLKK